MDKKELVKTGAGIGSMIAITISWSIYQSIVWAMIHGFFGWFYVIYFAVTRNQ